MGNTIRIWANDSLNYGRSAWLHEYVHTQQYSVNHFDPVTSPQMQWYREADANYYAGLVAYNENRASFNSLWEYQHARDKPYHGTLANKSSWHSNWIEYARGPVVLGYFDTQIRRQTHGNASFLNVMRTINIQEKHGKKLTLTRFEHDLEQYLSKTTVNHAVAAYIQSNHTIPVSTRYSAYTLPPTPINTSRPAPPTGLGKNAYQNWLYSSNATSQQTPTQQTKSQYPATSSSSPGFGVGIALIAISIASALGILRLRRSP